MNNLDTFSGSYLSNDQNFDAIVYSNPNQIVVKSAGNYFGTGPGMYPSLPKYKLDISTGNYVLFEANEDTKTKAPKGSENLAQGYDEIVLHYTCESNDGTVYDFQSTHSWKGVIDTTWNDVFAQIAPLLISEINEHQIKVALNKFVEKLGTEILKNNKDAKGHKFKSFVINEDDYQTIKVQLRALGLIEQSDKKRAISDKGTYWTLTPM
jgi:hypothetical protein